MAPIVSDFDKSQREALGGHLQMMNFLPPPPENFQPIQLATVMVYTLNVEEAYLPDGKVNPKTCIC